MTLTRPVGWNLPCATAMMSIRPKYAQAIDAAASAQMIQISATRTGEGGVSRISSAGARNALSALRRRGAGGRFGAGLRDGLVHAEISTDSTLKSPKMRVEPAGAFQELLVGARFDDAPVDHADDAMTAAHRRQTMGDDDDGSVPDDPTHVALDQTLAVIVQRGGRLVEYQYPRIGGERPRDRQPLALAARKIGAALLDHRVVALGQLVDELVGARQTRHLDHLRARHRGLGEGDVLVDGAIEEQALLQDDADVPAQPSRIDLAQIRSVQQNLPFVRQIEALDQLGERRFARAGRADDADDLAGANLERNIFENVGRVRTVSERDMANFDLAARGRQRDAGERSRLGRCVENVAEAIDRDLHLLEVLPDLRKPQDRLHGLHGDHVEGHQRPHGQFAVDHCLGAEQQQRRRGQLADVLDRVLAPRAQQRRREAGMHVGGELLLPLRAHDRLDRGRLDRRCADDRLDQELLARRAAIEFLLDLLAQDRTDREADDQIKRNGRQHDQRQLDRISEKHRDEHESEE